MVALIKPATPAAALVWPMLALIEPMAAGGDIGLRFAARAGEHFEFGRVADGGAGAVAFAIGNGFDAKTGAAIGAAQGLELAVASGRVMPPLPSEEIPQPRMTA